MKKRALKRPRAADDPGLPGEPPGELFQFYLGYPPAAFGDDRETIASHLARVDGRHARKRAGSRHGRTPRGARQKTRGMVYTPRAVADLIVRHTTYHALRDACEGLREASAENTPEIPPRDLERGVESLAGPDRPRIRARAWLEMWRGADACCGIGTFGLALRDAFVAVASAVGMDGTGELEGRFFLADLDADAVALARRVWTATSSRAGPDHGEGGPSLPGAFKHVDALLASPAEVPTGAFDLVVGNPPYVSNSRLRREALARASQYARLYSWMVENADLYVAFVELALTRLLKPGGYLGYITSNKWLTQNYGAALRRQLFEHYTLVEVIDLEGVPVFPGVKVDPVILIVKNARPPPDHHVLFLRPEHPPTAREWLDPATYQADRLPQASFRREPAGPGKGDYELRFDLVFDPVLRDLVNHMDAHGVPLATVAYFREGMKIHSKTYRDKTKRKPKAAFIKPANPRGTFKPLIDDTRVIHRYFVDPTIQYLDYQPTVHLSPAFPELFEARPKIVVTNVGGYALVAALDETGRYTSHNVINVVRLDLLPREAKSPTSGRVLHRVTAAEQAHARQYPHEVLVAVLNSRLVQAYFRAKVGDGIHVYPKHLRAVKIPAPSVLDAHPEIVAGCRQHLRSLLEGAKQSPVPDFETSSTYREHRNALEALVTRAFQVPAALARRFSAALDSRDES